MARKNQKSATLLIDTRRLAFPQWVFAFWGKLKKGVCIKEYSLFKSKLCIWGSLFHGPFVIFAGNCSGDVPFPSLFYVWLHLSICFVPMGIWPSLVLQDESLSDPSSQSCVTKPLYRVSAYCSFPWLFTIWHLHPGGFLISPFLFAFHRLANNSISPSWMSLRHLFESLTLVKEDLISASLYTKPISLQTAKDAALLF